MGLFWDAGIVHKHTLAYASTDTHRRDGRYATPQEMPP